MERDGGQAQSVKDVVQQSNNKTKVWGHHACAGGPLQPQAHQQLLGLEKVLKRSQQEEETTNPASVILLLAGGFLGDASPSRARDAYPGLRPRIALREGREVALLHHLRPALVEEAFEAGVELGRRATSSRRPRPAAGTEIFSVAPTSQQPRQAGQAAGALPRELSRCCCSPGGRWGSVSAARGTGGRCHSGRQGRARSSAVHVQPHELPPRQQDDAHRLHLAAALAQHGPGAALHHACAQRAHQGSVRGSGPAALHSFNPPEHPPTTKCGDPNSHSLTVTRPGAACPCQAPRSARPPHDK